MHKKLFLLTVLLQVGILYLIGSDYEALQTDIAWDSEVLKKALEEDLIQWENDSNVNTEYTRYGVLHTGKSLNYLAMVAFYDKKNQYPQAPAKIAEHLRFVVSGGKEPCCRGTIAGWADNALAQSITLAKYTPNVWNQFTDAEKEKLDWLMKALVIAGNYCQNLHNDIHVCLYQSFEWRKEWNPNHQEGYIGIMIAAWIYFGGANAVNKIFGEFDYDEYISRFTDYGFTNIISCWRSAGKNLMEHGGTDAQGGKTMGVKIPFKYKSLAGFGEIDYDPALLYRDLSVRMFGHRVTSSNCDGKAFILDGSKSPYEGQPGMCFEFSTSDASGCRSSVRYVYDGWFNNILTAATMKAFGLLDSADDKIQRMHVGTSDFLFKLQHGYNDYMHGQSRKAAESDLYNLGYIFMLDIYNKIFSKL
ncbi:MAG: hypothetical protein LBB62_04610 [Proteiniphilum sp.]|jgi:hypothetical protein|nr:hypothetical protein [Proteiniphilum sp.]